MDRRFRTPICAAALIFVASAGAETLRLDVQPDKSRIAFHLAGNVHDVAGTFRISEGHVLFDPESPSLEGRIVASAASGTAKNSKVVKRMQKEILESVLYPDIVFSPQRLEGVLQVPGNSRVTLEGIFEIHGASQSLSFPAEIVIDGNYVTATMEMIIPYVAWGMKDPDRFFFKSDDEVEVDIVLVGALRPTSTAVTSGE